MAFRHGVYKQEVPPSLTPPVQTEAELPLIVGTAPIHLAFDEEAMENVNKPQLIYTYSEAVTLFGYSRDWEKYTLCEFIYSQFELSATTPCVMVNVLDPAKHKAVIAHEFAIVEGAVDLGPDVLLNWTFAASTPTEDDDARIYRRGTDYSLNYDEDGYAILSVLEGGALSGKSRVFVNFERLKPELVTTYDILDGVEEAVGDYRFLEMVNGVSLRFGVD